MVSPPRSPSPQARRWAFPLTLALALVGAGAHAADDQPPAQASAPALSLGDCLHLALQRQPRIAAQRASLAAALDGSRALENLGGGAALLTPELSIRRRQASLGVTAATALVDQAERETIYAVTRSYYTAVFAHEQEALAQRIVDRLTSIHDNLKQQVEGGARQYTEQDVKKATTYLRLAMVRRIEASQGVRRALAALREAIGLCPEDTLQVALVGLTAPIARPVREEVIGAAIARRAELIRAGVYVDVTCLEVEAQGTGIHKRMETFAAGADIHATVVPQGSEGTEYRPGSLPPEMPDLLVGSKPDRMARAQDFNARARAVADVTRNLIALEAEDAYLRWEQAYLQAPEALTAAEAEESVADELSKALTSKLNPNIKVDEVLTSRVLAGQARAQYHEYVYRQILILAELERITGGGFCAHLVAIPAPANPESPK